MKPGESKLNRNGLSGGRQLRQSTLDRQYLFEMGIDVWAMRNRTSQKDAIKKDSIQGDAIAGAGSLSGTSPAGTSPAPFATRSAHELCENLAEFPVDLPDTNAVNSDIGNNKLLIVIESPAPDSKSTALLDNMFNAIDIHAPQRHVVVVSAGGATTVGAVAATVRPAAIVVMTSSRVASASSENSENSAVEIDGLNNLRGVQHQPVNIDPWVVVTFHPADLLDCPEAKRPAWEDLKLLHQWLKLPG